MNERKDSPEYRFLRELAEDLSSGDLSFPTFLDATVKVRMALKSPNLNAEALARIVGSEPLLSVKVIRLANSAALNPGGKAITDLKTAVIRVGFSSVRTLAIAVAMDQLLQAKHLDAYASEAKGLWEHSLEVAALSHVIAKAMTRINPHEAMFAGLVHDIGQFYLLSRVTRREDLCTSREELTRILFDWHASVGHAVLSALNVPQEIVQAVDDHETEFTADEPRTLGEIISFANRLAEHRNPFAIEAPEPPAEAAPRSELIATLVEQSREELASIMAALRS